MKIKQMLKNHCLFICLFLKNDNKNLLGYGYCINNNFIVLV